MSKQQSVNGQTKKYMFERLSLSSFAGHRVIKAIILAGGESSILDALTSSYSKPMLPILNRPLLETQLICLARNGFREIGIALSPEVSKQVSSYFGDGEKMGLRIHYIVASPPRGPAGCLTLFREFIKNDPFLVLDASVYLGQVVLSEFIRLHFDNKAQITLGMYEDLSTKEYLENVSISREGKVSSFSILHSSQDMRKRRRFAGLYLFDSNILEHIDGDGHFDIKEQLIHRIQEQGYSVFCQTIQGVHPSILSPLDYYKAHYRILRLGMFDHNAEEEVADGVWIGEHTRLSESALIVGPVLIGKNCIIEDGVKIIGPTVIGDYSRVGTRSLVRESILWNDTQVPDDAKIEYSIIGPKDHISLDRMRTDPPVLSDPVCSTSDNGGWTWPSAGKLRPALAAKLMDIIRRTAKRMLDIVISSVGLILSFPLCLIIALIIKLNSPGPVFFGQKRCGQHGREFRMFKFRTMVKDADKKQSQLYTQKDVDGPMFKMQNDPRLTSVGFFLRKTSLDELPQLFNVLKGDMSLVGPRPLVMKEMRFSPGWRDLRLKVKPGITGLWQINGRSHAPFHDWIKYDIFYVKNQSVLLDLKILAQTLRLIIGKERGVY